MGVGEIKDIVEFLLNLIFARLSSSSRMSEYDHVSQIL